MDLPQLSLNLWRILSLRLHYQTSVVMEAVLKVVQDHPLHDLVEFYIVDGKPVAFVEVVDFSHVDLIEQHEVMALHDVGNGVREDAVQELVAFDQFLSLSNAERTVSGAGCHEVNHRQVKIEVFLLLEQRLIDWLFGDVILFPFLGVRFDDTQLLDSERPSHHEQSPELGTLDQLLQNELLVGVLDLLIGA